MLANSLENLGMKKWCCYSTKHLYQVLPSFLSTKIYFNFTYWICIYQIDIFFYSQSHKNNTRKNIWQHHEHWSKYDDRTCCLWRKWIKCSTTNNESCYIGRLRWYVLFREILFLIWIFNDDALVKKLLNDWFYQNLVDSEKKYEEKKIKKAMWKFCKDMLIFLTPKRKKTSQLSYQNWFSIYLRITWTRSKTRNKSIYSSWVMKICVVI